MQVRLRLVSQPGVHRPYSRGLVDGPLQVNLAAGEGGITSEANVTDIHEALNFDQNDSVRAERALSDVD